MNPAAAADELRPGVTAYPLMRAIGNPRITGPDYHRADAGRMVAVLLAGCRRPA